MIKGFSSFGFDGKSRLYSADQTAAFAAGFGAVVPPPLRARMKGILDGGDLSVLIAGAAVIELADWVKHAAYAEPVARADFTVRCFWAAMVGRCRLTR